jgi:hypothetical protein
VRKLWKPLLALSLLAAPLWAGALLLTIGNPSADPAAMAQHAVLVARITACHSPEKTTVTASAEGFVNGVRKSIPLKVTALPTAGTFGVTRQWPDQGTWAIKLIATNPEYKDYATGLVVPSENGSVQFQAVKQYFHAPTDKEVLMAMN